MRGKYLDVVICGPDMSGTSTQIKGIISFFNSINYKVRDLRGTELEALFHAEKFKEFNEGYSNLSKISENKKKEFLFKAYSLMSGFKRESDLMVASCVKNNVSTYINPALADVWILEEPTKRGSGQVNRAIEQNRSEYGEELDGVSAAITHSVYRIDEFLRFRKPFRENNRIIIRSRSEESACYQIYNNNFFRSGISLENYLSLPGHKIAFKSPPTNIFVVCGPKNWKKEEYIKLKEKRSRGRRLDDHEKKVDYQLLVNQRYATDWLENLYKKGTKMYGGKMPEITRFNIYDTPEEIDQKMAKKISLIL